MPKNGPSPSRSPSRRGASARRRLLSEDRSARRALAESLAMTVLILSYIWLWQDSFPGDFLVCVLLFAGIGIAAHRRAGESPRAVGFRADNLPRALLQAALFVGPLIVAAPLAGVCE